MVVVGLGNPGPRYANTRHNVGYIAVDRISAGPPLSFRRRLFASYAVGHPHIPETFRKIVAVRYLGYMNRSGEMAPALLRRYGLDPSDLLVVVDNMDLPPGSCRLKKGGGDAGHNGLKSMVGFLGTGGFLRLYIGVGRPEKGTSVVDHVLGVPEDEELSAIDAACTRAAKAIRNLAESSFGKVAEEFNRRGS